MNENKIMEQTNETVNDVNEVEETGNISGGIGILVVGAFALGGAAVVGAKKAYRWFKDRKHKPEVVDGDVKCVNDEEVQEEESENK